MGIFNISCVKIYLRVTGLKNPRTVNKEVLATYLGKQGLYPEYILEVDSVRYKNLIEQKLQDTLVYKNPNWWVQNHIHP